MCDGKGAVGVDEGEMEAHDKDGKDKVGIVGGAH